MWSFLVGGNNNDSVDSVDDSDSSTSSSIVFANIVTGCSKSNHTQYLEHDKDTWTLLQQAHDRVKGKRSHYKAHHTGMMVPFEIRSSSSTPIGGGRDGQNVNDERYLYVTEDVQQGTQLWQPLHYVTFHSQKDYVKFLIEVGEHHLQCEVLSWTHPSIHQSNGTDMYVDITLDEGTFIAEEEKEQQQQEKANIDINCRAIREIKAGEKIIMNGSTEYSDTINEKEVDWFNDIRESAWKRTGLGQQQRVHLGSRLLCLRSGDIMNSLRFFSGFVIADLLIRTNTFASQKHYRSTTLVRTPSKGFNKAPWGTSH
ncbi:hypothetical protein FRACYDRAFT_254172 [Fragilariopsis cylindrus CCMP1102]|uniref:Uncharacterized protein n=1 Tax=Fragilariopsis cylindrus CCMP1102 TaxID=635003 RepID=A0A1E7EL28_9STRA|nr:hypothetical protein FRACYDRAFT_254172 [Fragilariopsis cylindrus CCMP1102]|eukprot:OEU06621.1 hypothetical protein FRACYDRAFT_254172 [Fragilariopsis cylindrus CCMP1102]